jgi:hypothetical protein
MEAIPYLVLSHQPAAAAVDLMQPEMQAAQVVAVATAQVQSVAQVQQIKVMQAELFHPTAQAVMVDSAAVVVQVLLVQPVLLITAATAATEYRLRFQVHLSLMQAAAVELEITQTRELMEQAAQVVAVLQIGMATPHQAQQTPAAAVVE